MWRVWLLGLFLLTAPALAEFGFDEKYERDYNIFNPANRYQSDNPLNPAQAYSPDNPFNPANRYDPGNPVNPANRYSPNNPFNPANEYNPANPLNPANRFNPSVPFAPETGSFSISEASASHHFCLRASSGSRSSIMPPQSPLVSPY